MPDLVDGAVDMARKWRDLWLTPQDLAAIRRFADLGRAFGLARLTRECLVAWLRRQIGGVPEWLKGTDCKSVSSAYVGSNPTPSTTAGPEASAIARKAYRYSAFANSTLMSDPRLLTVTVRRLPAWNGAKNSLISEECLKRL